MKRKLLAMMAFMSVIAIVFTGCGSNTASEEQETQTSTETVTGENTEEVDGNSGATGESEESTVTVDKDNIIKAGDDTVVASSVAVVQILDALGVPMAGVPTSSYELPESVTDSVRIGNPMEPDMEVIAALEPTIVVSVDSLSEDLTKQFEIIGAESFFVNLSSYDGLKESILALGTRFGVEEKAQELVAGFEEREAAIAASVEGKESPSVLIIFGAGSSFMVASEDTYVGDLVKQVGGTNIITDAPASFSPVDMEYLASQNPEYILFMAHANPEESMEAFKKEFETNVAWQSFDAVQNDKVIALETGYFGMSANLQAIDAMEKLVGILYE